MFARPVTSIRNPLVRKLTQQLNRGRGDPKCSDTMPSQPTFAHVCRREAVAKNMRGELAQARPVTFSVAATAAGTRIKLAWRETGSVPAHRPSDPGDLSRLGHDTAAVAANNQKRALTAMLQCPGDNVGDS